MNWLIAQVPPPSFWNAPNGSPRLWGMIALGALLGLAFMIGMMYVPTRARRPIVVTFTFVAGLVYVLQYLFPRAINRTPTDLPLNGAETVAFWLEDAITQLGDVANTIAGFMLGLGIYSLLRIHSRRLFKMQKDWAFSLVLLLSMLVMVIFGYWDWIVRQRPDAASIPATMADWPFALKAKDLLFDGLLQQMDAAMFSLIAFFILSAAYRAFRVRSIEATILLATALIVMFSLMGVVQSAWDSGIDAMAGGDKASFIQNFTLTNIAIWIQQQIQVPGLRAIDFGIGVGALAMSLRLWLSLERQGVGA